MDRPLLVSVARSPRGRFSKRESESFVFGIIACGENTTYEECPPHRRVTIKIKRDISCTRHLEVHSRSINTCSDHHYLCFKSSRSTPSGPNLTRAWVVMVILTVFMLWASVATITYWFDNSDDAKKPIETSTPRVVAGDVPYQPIQIV